MATLAPPARAADATRCANCDEPTFGAFCHACGQEQRPLPTLHAFLADGLGDALSVDGRLWHTLRPLLLHPGRLSRSYLEGRRIRYVPPLRLYMTVSVLYFGAFVLLDARFFMGMRLEGLGGVLSRLMILVVPGFAVLLHLLFGRGRHGFVEDLVVALHYHAFAFLLLLVLAATAACGEDSTASAEAPDPEKVEITIQDGTVEPLGQRLEVARGQEVQLVVKADGTGELHVHSDPEQELTYDQGTSMFTVNIDKPGVVDVETHDPEQLVLQLEVS